MSEPKEKCKHKDEEGYCALESIYNTDGTCFGYEECEYYEEEE